MGKVELNGTELMEEDMANMHMTYYRQVTVDTRWQETKAQLIMGTQMPG
jgi:hypothetical protein